MKFKDEFSWHETLYHNVWLTHMFGVLNQLSVFLQGHDLSIIDSYEKKLNICRRKWSYGYQIKMNEDIHAYNSGCKP
jgi:hypothetical protein